MNSNTTLGILEWFHFEDKEHVYQTLEQMRELGITDLRTGISWADYHREGGYAWLSWLIPTLAAELKIMPCFLYTPPSIAVEPHTSAPPRNPNEYGEFVKLILQEFGHHFEYVELWNEPNNQSEYDYRLDPGYDIFLRMIASASTEAKLQNKKVVLGGMSPIAPEWLDYMFKKGLGEFVDVVGIHGFPETFYSMTWHGWQAEIDAIQKVIDKHQGKQKIWITETGYSTWKNDEAKQVAQFIDVLEAPVERVYWYCLNDLSQNRPTVDGFHLDEREYHFGMFTNHHFPKLLYRLLSTYSVEQIPNLKWLTEPHISSDVEQKGILIFGGAGFVGINLAEHFLKQGEKVILFDNINRQGVEANLAWLKNKYKSNLDIHFGDIRNKFQVNEVVQQAKFVYHFAAQVAVTLSVAEPVYDMNVNIMGTLNILEAIRNSNHQPPIVFTSTNKVYGDLNHYEHVEKRFRYECEQRAIDETQALDFHSPYGCSKGAADQYVSDYSRIFGLKTIVMRMSCIYGPHQFGTEDQGWVAHFMIQALGENRIMLYGDGKQVRDILYVDDLIKAFQLCYEQIDNLSGQVFNIGGGIENSTSLLEYLELLEEILGHKIGHRFSDWRPGDQKYYVSDYSKFESATGWKPVYSIGTGVRSLYDWLQNEKLIIQNV